MKPGHKYNQIAQISISLLVPKMQTSLKPQSKKKQKTQEVNSMQPFL
uniref:Uncharacterized protein n=1 Tax=Rhizophora mucronata TaxID=61149 RepID=A0A2P2NCP7_RHIMU